MKRHCLALDLVDDETSINTYKAYHKNVWPEIVESIYRSGILSMEIYLVSNRLFMIMEVNNDFSFNKKSEMDKNNLKVAEWEKLMWQYQQALPTAKPGEKWMLMDKIFEV